MKKNCPQCNAELVTRHDDQTGETRQVCKIKKDLSDCWIDECPYRVQLPEPSPHARS